eukprot:TRINITY_DN25096_c0_g1_i1.p1 TRINITY_DN25096_c0_g1~~TRINITY_DN25096_c0_g1_i1.p1  ORF type:complete len:257 (+),score=19.18 TRINITY_DN25096_c0_g1_i1:115-885(+)
MADCEHAPARRGRIASSVPVAQLPPSAFASVEARTVSPIPTAAVGSAVGLNAVSPSVPTGGGGGCRGAEGPAAAGRDVGAPSGPGASGGGTAASAPTVPVVPPPRRAPRRRRTYCVCSMPDFGDQIPMVCCDACKQWYHAACLGVTDQECNAMANFLCPWCALTGNTVTAAAPVKRSRRSAAERVVGQRVCVCQARDDGVSFVLWCADCEDHVHPRCVGVDVAEVERVFARQASAVFLCPPCRNYRANTAAAEGRA